MTQYLDRGQSLQRIRDRNEPWDVLVIGGGATGIGIALDAASRGLSVVLLERSDFGCGTSSRSTKLVHGGVRYLRQGNITLVRDALRERSCLRENAPHLVHDKTFLIPCENRFQWFFYGIGLKLYDLLAVRNQFGRSRMISAGHAAAMAPAIRADKLHGAVLYHDGQFDDTRLLVQMAITACDQGACLLNYANVDSIEKTPEGGVGGVRATDTESGESIQVDARCVINAAGPFCDQVRRMDDSGCEPMVAASQGVHVVLPAEFYEGETAMIVPKTSDGRVIFIVPWHGHALVGTTDTAIPHAVAEPDAQPSEIDFLLETAARYLTRPPRRDDVLSVFTGIRPLVKGDRSQRTASLSRDHVIRVSDSNLVTITGGKWTTVRKMAEDCVDRAIEIGSLRANPCRTETLPIHQNDVDRSQMIEDAQESLTQVVDESTGLQHADVVWAVRNEMARTVEDVLARRTRLLFLNSQAAIDAAPKVADLMADELGYDRLWVQRQLEAFADVAAHYRCPAAT